MSEQEYNLCPKCKGPIWLSHGTKHRWYVCHLQYVGHPEIEHCENEQLVIVADNKEHAIEAWNRRAE